MTRASGIVCAAAVMSLWLAGCAGDGSVGQRFSAMFFAQAGEDTIMVGTKDVVAVQVKSSLDRLGLAATITPQGSAIRIASKTGPGQEFAMVLTEEDGPRGKQTRIKMEWTGNPDQQTKVKIMANVSAQPIVQPLHVAQ